MVRKRHTSFLEERGIELEKRMYEKRSRYLILFLTLNYKPEHRGRMTLDDLRGHRDRLLKNVQCNSLLGGIEAYIWKIEEGGVAGLHLHLLLFYSGERRGDVYITKSIGEYWETTVTRGLGAYWSSNANKDRLVQRGKPVGVGQIDRGDMERRAGILQIIRYLAEPGQEIGERPGHGRTFGMSALP